MKMASKKAAAMVAAALLAPAFMASSVMAEQKGRAHNPDLGVVYVEGQGLYYDTFVTTVIPPVGRFQPLYPGVGPGGVSVTPYGPGDKDFVGGRWWIDTNMDGEMDGGDTYVSCPLLGPGRTEP